MPEPQRLGDADQVEKKEDWDDSQDGLLSCFCLVVLRDKMNTGPYYPVYAVIVQINGEFFKYDLFKCKCFYLIILFVPFPECNADCWVYGS